MSSRQPEEATYFLDRSLGKHVVADALRGAGESVELHDDHFDQAAPDESWLKAVGVRGWVVLTKDSRIRSRHNELEAIRLAGARVFVLTSANLTAKEMSEAFLRALPGIRRLNQKLDSPFIGLIDRTGRVREYKPAARDAAPTSPP